MDVGDPPHVRPRLGDGERAGATVSRLDVGDAENVVRIGNGSIEQEIGAAVHEDREDLELFGDWPQSRRIAARGDAAEKVDLLLELHPAQLLDVRIRAGGLVRLKDLDLAPAEKPAGRVDF